jgi:hypothetical protein
MIEIHHFEIPSQCTLFYKNNAAVAAIWAKFYAAA